MPGWPDRSFVLECSQLPDIYLFLNQVVILLVWSGV